MVDDAAALPHGHRGHDVVAGGHDRPQLASIQRLDCLLRARFQLIFEEEQPAEDHVVFELLSRRAKQILGSSSFF